MSEEKDDVLKAMVKIAARATSFSDFQGKTADLKKQNKIILVDLNSAKNKNQFVDYIVSLCQLTSPKNIQKNRGIQF